MNKQEKGNTPAPQGSIIGRLSGELLMQGIVPEVIDPDNYLQTARTYLETGSAILLFNHASNDFGMWARFIRENLTSLENVTALVAMKYLDPNRGIGSKAFSFLLSKWREEYGLDAFPLVQAKDNAWYPNNKTINFGTLMKTKKHLKQAGHLVAFSPEGTRSLTGELQRAVEDSDIIIRHNKDSIIIPVAADFPTTRPMKPYMYIPIKIHVGRPFFALEIDDEHAKNPEIEKRDLMALRIARIISPANQGYYKDLVASTQPAS